MRLQGFTVEGLGFGSLGFQGASKVSVMGSVRSFSAVGFRALGFGASGFTV